MAQNIDLRKIKQNKRLAKAGFTRIETFLDNLDPETVNTEEVKLRLNKLEEFRKSLEESLTELGIHDEEFTEERVDEELSVCEEKYISLRLRGERLIKERVRPALAINNLNQAAEVPPGARARTNESLVRLPKIDLPAFSGAYEEWHSFFNTFNSLIHSNNSLNDIQKFHYLKSSVKGEAAETIASLEISEIHYNDAWLRLKERYDNERVAIQNHIKAIFDLPMLKRENSVMLRNILDSTLKHTRALTALKCPTEHWDDLLVFIVSNKLDYTTIKEWEASLEARQLPKFSELIEFLTRRCQMLEAVARRSLSVTPNVNSRQANVGKVSLSHAAITNVKCLHCKSDHQIYQCKAFKELSVADRLNKVTTWKLCLNCFRGKHFAKDCTASGCKKCSKKHNTLLHDDRDLSKTSKEETNKQSEAQENVPSKAVNTICTHLQSKEIESNQVLLSTASIRVKNHENYYIEGRVLLDSKSQSNFVTEEFVQRLKLRTVENKIEIKGINQHISHAVKSVNLKVTSRFGTYGLDLHCIVLPKITQNLPTVVVDTVALEIPKNINLADPQFNIPGKIDILIGAESFWELICVGQIKLGKRKPVLQKSLLGWLVSGPTRGSDSKSPTQTSCNVSTLENLNDTMHKFWEVEGWQETSKLSPEEEYCEEHFKTTHERHTNGRFIVKLPVKEEVLNFLEGSKEIALKRFLSLERKFAKKPELKKEYVKFMREYLQLGHMRQITDHNKNKLRVFLPHHAVIKESSTTTKTRVVFDASSQYLKGKSLNDALYKGPVIQSDLFTLIIRFRCHKYVLCADISKMHRQILINKKQIPLQSILWRENPELPIEEFELLTVTYGTKPASFLATKCLQQLAESEKINYPKAAEVVCKDFYMDDLLTGGNTKSEIIKLRKELTELLTKGGFELHKWNSNIANQDISINVDDEAVDISKDTDCESKLLGIFWSPIKDTFHYKVLSKDSETRVTKRVMLSQICKLFDPLGLVGPVVTSAKILMQELWSLGTEWNESVPMHVYRAWDQIKLQLHLLNDLKIPRLVVSGMTDSQIQIHGFCDASEKAYGACVYLRDQDHQGHTIISLLCAKSRVAPMKALSLPRLELCGAVLLVNLMDKVINSLDFKMRQRFYWTDSKIVLAWINSLSRKWQVFVANRVSEIHDKSSPSEWQHIKSKDNPADLISRGCTPDQLMQANIWWGGPPWLKENKELWPKKGEELSYDDVPERRKQAIIAATVNYETIIDFKRFSTLNKLLRVVAYVLRFIYNVKCKKEKRKIGTISTAEFNNAKMLTIKLIQQEEFKDDIRSLKSSNKVQKNSRLAALHPYLDNDGILRVGGRLKHTALSEEMKHPILLSTSHYFTTLIIVHHHEKLFHAGVQTTLNSIREEFWPIFAKNRIKKVLRSCVRCRKAHPKPSWQLMGELPSVRVNISRPFSNCGVDYCGPFFVRDRIRRNSKKYKAYVAIFICMATKAVHIELVEDLTTESFLASFKRLMTRRGKVKNMYSDNGRNFVGADRVLQQIFEDKKFNEAVQEFATEERISWHFIPPRSPHYGGLWEAAVRSMKLLLKRTLSDVCLTVGEMTTVLTQVEAILNSRPLTPLSEDPNDLKAITPGHFLIGEHLHSYPEEDLQNVPENRLSRWQLVERLKQQLWSRWQREYLVVCQQRNKWKKDSGLNFAVGQLVMLKECESMPFEWVLARITEIHPGLDEKIRAVTVQTKKGIYKRAITNIAPIFD